MKQEFFYEPNCVENGEWIPEKEILEDTLVLDLRRSWNQRHNLEHRHIQHLLGDPAAIWRFKREHREGRRRLARKIRAYRSNREFAPDLHQSLETWYLQNSKKRMDISPAVRYVLTSSWAKDPSLFQNAKAWKSKFQTDSEKLWRT